jgi:hypothetical protein
VLVSLLVLLASEWVLRSRYGFNREELRNFFAKSDLLQFGLEIARSGRSSERSPVRLLQATWYQFAWQSLKVAI